MDGKRNRQAHKRKEVKPHRQMNEGTAVKNWRICGVHSECEAGRGNGDDSHSSIRMVMREGNDIQCKKPIFSLLHLVINVRNRYFPRLAQYMLQAGTLQLIPPPLAMIASPLAFLAISFPNIVSASSRMAVLGRGRSLR